MHFNIVIFLGQCSVMILAQSTRPTCCKTTSKHNYCFKRKTQGPPSSHGSKQHFNIGQCQSLVKMLANQGNKLLTSNSPLSEKVNTKQRTQTCTADSQKNLKEEHPGKDTESCVTANVLDKSSCLSSYSHDKLYIQNLLDTVDRAISLEYGTHSIQSLSLDETFEVLETVENEYKHRKQTEKWHNKQLTEIGRKRSKGCCKHCNAENKRARIGEGYHESGDSNLSGLPARRGGNNGGQDLGLLLLSRSEERTLMNDLEQDARKMSTSLSSYLRCAAEGISSCFVAQS